MHRLLIARHGITEEARAEGDMARELTEDGVANAKLAAAWLRDHHLHPEAVICSPATRARQTADEILDELGMSHDHINIERGIYHGNKDDVLHALGESHGDITMVVGHNPTLTDLAYHLGGLEIGDSLSLGSIIALDVAGGFVEGGCAIAGRFDP